MATVLDYLKGLVSPTPGKIPGTKDYNISENLGLGTGIDIPINLASKYLGATPASTTQEGTIDNNPSSDYQDPTTSPQNSNYYTGNPAGGGGTPGKTSEDIANEQRQSRINAIKSQLSRIRDVANRQIGVAGNVRDSITGNIRDTYGNVRTQADQRQGTALENLTQEGVKTGDIYEGAKGTSRRALESAMLKNRMLARSMGRLDSSFYDDRQAQATETGARNIGELSRENAYKQAGLETRKTETGNYFDNVRTTADQEEAQLLSQAEFDYQDRVNSAMDMEKAFGLDSEEELRSAQSEYESRLEAINQYIQNKDLQLALIKAQGGQFIGSNITPFQDIDAELGSILATNTAQQTQQEVPTFNSIAYPNSNMGYNYRSLLKNPEDEYTKQQSKLGNILYSLGNSA